jgi:hypothetical protein
MWTESQRTKYNHELRILGFTGLMKRMYKIIFICHMKNYENINSYLKKYNFDKKTEETRVKLKQKTTHPEIYLKAISEDL